MCLSNLSWPTIFQSVQASRTIWFMVLALLYYLHLFFIGGCSLWAFLVFILLLFALKEKWYLTLCFDVTEKLVQFLWSLTKLGISDRWNRTVMVWGIAEGTLAARCTDVPTVLTQPLGKLAWPSISALTQERSRSRVRIALTVPVPKTRWLTTFAFTLGRSRIHVTCVPIVLHRDQL